MRDSTDTLILFDVDGTLTSPRQPITMPMIMILRELCRHAEIGFLTGSNLDYIKEQLWPALNDTIIRQNCHILPCNGTEYYIPTASEILNFQSIYKASMKDEIGETQFATLLKILCKLHANLVQEIDDLPLTGNFIQNRNSMINWCPIGRNALPRDREQFKALDKLYGIRSIYLRSLKQELSDENIDIVIKLGGDTSFDIYPLGWDKTFALNHFDYSKWDFWFVGDRCGISGNDYEIFELLKDKGRAFETGSPEETIEIIEKYILEVIQYRR
jgi:phosphomannomutase